MSAPSGWRELTAFPTYGPETFVTAIAIGPDSFVAVGWSRDGDDTNGRIWKSTNGEDWVAQPDAAFAGLTLEALTYNGTDFFAFASAPTTVWKSADGAAWQHVPISVFGGELGEFDAFTGGYVSEAATSDAYLYGAGGTTVFAGDIACNCVAAWRSTDGIDWAQSIVVEDDTFLDMAVLPGANGAPDLTFVITYGTYIGQGFRYSTDFDTWQEPGFTLDEGSGLLDVAHDGQHLVAVGYAGENYDEAIAMVTDGTTWSTGSIDATIGGPAEQVTWGGGVFVAIGSGTGPGAVSWTSLDGTDWTRGPDVHHRPLDDPGPEPGDDPFQRREVAASQSGIVVAQTFADGLHVWFTPMTVFMALP